MTTLTDKGGGGNCGELFVTVPAETRIVSLPWKRFDPVFALGMSEHFCCNSDVWHFIQTPILISRFSAAETYTCVFLLCKCMFIFVFPKTNDNKDITFSHAPTNVSTCLGVNVQVSECDFPFCRRTQYTTANCPLIGSYRFVLKLQSIALDRASDIRSQLNPWVSYEAKEKRQEIQLENSVWEQCSLAAVCLQFVWLSASVLSTVRQFTMRKRNRNPQFSRPYEENRPICQICDFSRQQFLDKLAQLDLEPKVSVPWKQLSELWIKEM